MIITLNEADGIKRAIQSAAFCDDCVVLDSGSTDSTVAIAEDLGARVFVEPFRGFREQKARATELARYDWILSLDGDEELSPALQAELVELFEQKVHPLANQPAVRLAVSNQPVSNQSLGSQFAKNPLKTNRAIAVRFPRLTWTMGRWIRHGGWYPDRQLRFFNRKSSEWTGGAIHELVSSKSDSSSEPIQIIDLQNNLWHFPFSSHSVQVETNNRYSGLGAIALSEKGRRFRLVLLLFKPVSKWIECYLIKLGFLDGLPGFIIAVGAAYSMFLKYVKLWEIEARPQKRPPETDSARR